MFYIIFNSHIINASTYEYIIRKQINENTNTAFQLQLIQELVPIPGFQSIAKRKVVKN